jgi:hypothetical protein
MVVSYYTILEWSILEIMKRVNHRNKRTLSLCLSKALVTFKSVDVEIQSATQL